MNTKKSIGPLAVAMLVGGLLSACATPPAYDVILRGGTIYDGSGCEPWVGDVALQGDRIAALDEIGEATAPVELDVRGLAVAPGLVHDVLGQRVADRRRTLVKRHSPGRHAGDLG